jgi:predicted translin family RNA/ssDNA-binding protein
LNSAKNQQAVLKQQEQLKQAAIVQWMEILDAATTTVNVADAESIQDSLDELQRVHGALTELKEDITQSEDSLFGAILDSIEVKPNKK